MHNSINNKSINNKAINSKDINNTHTLCRLMTDNTTDSSDQGCQAGVFQHWLMLVQGCLWMTFVYLIPTLKINISRKTSENVHSSTLSEFDNDRLFLRIGMSIMSIVIMPSIITTTWAKHEFDEYLINPIEWSSPEKRSNSQSNSQPNNQSSQTANPTSNTQQGKLPSPDASNNVQGFAPTTDYRTTAQGNSQNSQTTAQSSQLNKSQLNDPVIDPSNFLNSADKQKISQRLRSIYQRDLAQAAVVIVPSTSGVPIFNYAMDIANTWKLGDANKDNGLLIVVAYKDRDMYILTGDGLRGILPDSTVKSIIKNDITPHFKKSNYAAGLLAGINRIESQLDVNSRPSSSDSRMQFSSTSSYDNDTSNQSATRLSPIANDIREKSNDFSDKLVNKVLEPDDKKTPSYIVILPLLVMLFIGKIFTAIFGGTFGSTLLAFGFFLACILIFNFNFVTALVSSMLLWILLAGSAIWKRKITADDYDTSDYNERDMNSRRSNSWYDNDDYDDYDDYDTDSDYRERERRRERERDRERRRERERDRERRREREREERSRSYSYDNDDNSYSGGGGGFSGGGGGGGSW